LRRNPIALGKAHGDPTKNHGDDGNWQLVNHHGFGFTIDDLPIANSHDDLPIANSMMMVKP
jgi:hypothetical protein